MKVFLRIVLSILWFCAVVDYFTTDPKTDVVQAIPLIPLLLITAGTGVAAYGAYQQGQAAKQEGKNAQAIMNYNAQVAEQEGKSQQLKAEAEANKQQRLASEILAEQKATYGKSGVMFRGSPLTVMSDTAQQLELDRLMILREGAEAAKFAKSRAYGMRLQGKAYRDQGRNAARGSILSATGTILSGVGTGMSTTGN